MDERGRMVFTFSGGPPQGEMLVPGVNSSPVTVVTQPEHKKRKIVSSAGPAQGAVGAPAPTQPIQYVTIDMGGGKFVKVDAESRVIVKSKLSGKKLAGTAAPRAKMLSEWLDTHPEYEVCNDAPGRRPGKPRSRPAKSAETGRSRAAPKVSMKTPWPLTDSLESGPVGLYVSELRILHKEANQLLIAGYYKESDAVFQQALDLAKMTVDEYARIEEKIASLPPVRVRNPPAIKKSVSRPRSSAVKRQADEPPI